MDIEGRDPAGTRLQDLDKELTGKIVGTDGTLVRDEEDWLRRVEVSSLRGATTL